MNWRGREEIPSSNHLAYKSLQVTLQPGRGCEGTPPAREGKGGDSLQPCKACRRNSMLIPTPGTGFREGSEVSGEPSEVSGRVLRFQGGSRDFRGTF